MKKKSVLLPFLFLSLLLITGYCVAESSESLESFEVDLGPIPQNVKPLARANAVDPAVFIMHVGYKSYAAPDNAALECWETFDNLYVRGSSIYFGVVLINFETVPKRVGLAYIVKGTEVGSKNKTTKQFKTVPPRRLFAYFIRTTLPPVISPYTITAQLKNGSRVYDEMFSRFLINGLL